MKKLILIIVAAFLLSSCGVTLLTPDEYYYDPYPMPHVVYLRGVPYYYYDFYYPPRYSTPAPPKHKEPKHDINPEQARPRQEGRPGRNPQRSPSTSQNHQPQQRPNTGSGSVPRSGNNSRRTR